MLPIPSHSSQRRMFNSWDCHLQLVLQKTSIITLKVSYKWATHWNPAIALQGIHYGRWIYALIQNPYCFLSFLLPLKPCAWPTLELSYMSLTSEWTEASQLCYGILFKNQKEQTASIYNRCLHCDYITPNARSSLKKLHTLVPLIRHSRNIAGIESGAVVAWGWGWREDHQKATWGIRGRWVCATDCCVHIAKFVKVQNDTQGQILLYII